MAQLNLMAADHEILKWKLNRASVWQKYDSVKAPSIQAVAMWLYPCVIKEICMMSLMYGAFTQSRAHLHCLKCIHLPAGPRSLQNPRQGCPQRPWQAVKKRAPVEGVPEAVGTAEDKGPELECIKSFSAFVL